MLDRAVGRVRVGPVVHRQDHARQRLDEEGRERGGAERVEPVRVRRDLPEEEVAHSPDEARALLDPVDRVVDRLLEALPPG